VWDLLPRSLRLTITATLVVWTGWLISWGNAVVTGTAESPLHSISTVVTIIGTVLVALFGMTWRKFWRLIPVLERWQPDLTGRWEGTYLSSYVRPETGQNATGPMTMVIRQGLFTTSVTAKTGEMQSNSTRAWLESDRDAQRFQLGYTYRSEPKAAMRDRSFPHHGICWLRLERENGSRRLTGIYYTERRTIGDLEFSLVSRNPD
jgi:SMODS-associating 2TM, beta-strand rich effector domain